MKQDDMKNTPDPSREEPGAKPADARREETTRWARRAVHAVLRRALDLQHAKQVLQLRGLA